jgi:HTH-type transcriptional regulator/antitoxin HipB
VTNRRTLSDLRRENAANPEFQAAYAEARLRYGLKEAVRARREELGWSQTRLAERAGMRQPAATVKVHRPSRSGKDSPGQAATG